MATQPAANGNRRKKMSPLVKKLLKSSSRTFAIVLPQLHYPLSDWLGVAYLTARINDEVEDNPQIANEHKPILMKEINRAMRSDNPVRVESLERMLRGFDMTEEGYRNLFDNIVAVHEVIREFPPEVRDRIKFYSDEMATGFGKKSLQTIETFEDHYEYCHHAAGVWGRLITELTERVGAIPPEVKQVLLPKPELKPGVVGWRRGVNPADDYSIALQLINDTKDLDKDSAAGIRRWPSDLVRAHDLTFKDLGEIRSDNDPRLEKAYDILRAQIEDANRFIVGGTTWLREMPYDGNMVCWTLALGMAAATSRVMNSPAYFYRPESRKIDRDEVASIFQNTMMVVKEKRDPREYVTHLLSKRSEEYQ